MSKDFIEDIVPGGYKTRGRYTPSKKIYLVSHRLTFVSGIQAPQDGNHRLVTDDREEVVSLCWKPLSEFKQELAHGTDTYVPHGSLYRQTVIAPVEAAATRSDNK